MSQENKHALVIRANNKHCVSDVGKSGEAHSEEDKLPVEAAQFRGRW